MTRANEVKDRFRARLQEADARSNDFRKKLLQFFLILCFETALLVCLPRLGL